MRILHTNVVDAASNLISTPVCVSAMPISNIKLPERGKFARIVGATSWTVTGEVMGAIAGFSIVGHNFTGGATVRLRLYSDIAMTVVVYDSTALAVGTPQTWGNPAASPNGGLAWGVLPWMDTGLLPGTPEYFTIWFASVGNAAAFKLEVVDAGNADGFLQMGRIYMGSYWSPLVNVAYGLKKAWKEASVLARTDGGSLRTEGYLPYRFFSANFAYMAESDRGAFDTLLRKIGKRVDVLVSFYPGLGGALERDYTAAVKFTNLPDLSSVAASYFDTSAELEEI